MRLSLRFILPLASRSRPSRTQSYRSSTGSRFSGSCATSISRTSLIANTIQDPLRDLVREGSRAKVLRFFDRIMQDERLFAVGFCDPRAG